MVSSLYLHVWLTHSRSRHENPWEDYLCYSFSGCSLYIILWYCTKMCESFDSILYINHNPPWRCPAWCSLHRRLALQSWALSVSSKGCWWHWLLPQPQMARTVQPKEELAKQGMIWHWCQGNKYHTMAICPSRWDEPMLHGIKLLYYTHSANYSRSEPIFQVYSCV